MASVHFCSLKQDTEKDFQGNVFWEVGGLGAGGGRLIIEKLGVNLIGCRNLEILRTELKI